MNLPDKIEPQIDELREKIGHLYRCIWFDVQDGKNREDLFYKQMQFIFKKELELAKIEAMSDGIRYFNDTLYHLLPTGDSINAFEILKSVNKTQDIMADRLSELTKQKEEIK